MASWAPPLPARRPVRVEDRGRRPRERGVLRLGRHVVSDRDALLLAQRLGQVEHDLAVDAGQIATVDAGSRTMCEAARARVVEDLQLLAAALERSRLAS